MLGPKIFKLKRIVGQNNFESRQILSPENFWSKINWVHKKVVFKKVSKIDVKNI